MVESLEVTKYQDLFDDEKIEDTISHIVEEQSILINNMHSLKNEIIKEESKKVSYESDLWLKTNFKERGLSNKELREAYVDSKMKEYISTVGQKKNDLAKMNRQYELNNSCLSILTIYLKGD